MPREVRAFRGRIRAQINEAEEELNAVLRYNERHPETKMLTAQEQSIMESTAVTCQELLDRTKPR